MQIELIIYKLIDLIAFKFSLDWHNEKLESNFVDITNQLVNLKEYN